MKANIPATKHTIRAKQDILMPDDKGFHRPGCLVIAKGSIFNWNPRTKHYVHKLNGNIVASVSQKYVEQVNIFE